MRYLLICIMALFYTACSPKYEIKTLYTQPNTPQGKVCVKECNVKRETCQIHCNQKYNSCLEEAKKHAKENFPSVMDEYKDVMQQYKNEINHYEREIASWDRNHIRLEQQFQTYRELCNTKKDRKNYECRRAKEIENDLDSMKAIEPQAPSLPKKPLLSEEVKKAQKTCSNKCGCQKEYDNCFVSCGGTLDYKKFCIENCK